MGWLPPGLVEIMKYFFADFLRAMRRVCPIVLVGGNGSAGERAIFILEILRNASSI
jgi:hypothetical protein